MIICYDSDAINSKASIQAFKKSQPQIQLVEQPQCDFSNYNSDYDRIIKQSIQQGANSLFLAPHIDRIHEAVKIAKVNHQQPFGRRLRLFGGPSLYTSRTLEDSTGHLAVEDMQLLVPWHPYANISHRFIDDARKLWNADLDYKIVTWRTAMSYDATKAIAIGLNRADRPNRQQLQQTLSQPNFDFNGATGKVQFEYGERITKRVFLVEIGRWSRKTNQIDFIPIDNDLFSIIKE